MGPLLRSAAVGGALLTAAACSGASGSSTDGPSTSAPSTSTPSTTSQPAVARDAEAELAETGSDTLTLDYTAFVADTIQPSGIDIDATGSAAAIVTDFEKVVITDVATQEVQVVFDVGRRDLPRQGATEAVAFIDDHIAVLYPDDHVIGLFDTQGTPLRELVVDTTAQLDGAMTERDGQLILVARSADGTQLVELDPASGDLNTRAISDLATVEGLATSADGDAVVALTEEATIFLVDPDSGDVVPIGSVSEVDEPSGLAVLVNDEEGEVQWVVTDDADEYNEQPGPIRLYLAPTPPAR